jgi:general secretion pathway protein M
VSARPVMWGDPRRGRQLAVGLLVAVVAGLVAAIAIPVWMLHRHYDAALADNFDKLDRYRRIAQTRPQVARQLEAMSTRDPRKFFLRSGAAALSAAEAQESIRTLVESSGGRLITMGAPASRDEGRYRQVTVNVQLTANIFALRKILAAVEGNTPYLFVDNLTVRTQVPATFRPAPGAEPEMFVQFDVSGYAITGA